MDNVLLILKVLMSGYKITQGNYQYQMSEDYKLCRIAYDQHGNEKLLIVNFGEGISLAGFVKWCNDFNDDEITIIGANYGLNQI